MTTPTASKLWDIKCKAMFLGLHAANKLARELGLDPHRMLAKLQDVTQDKRNAAVGAVLDARDGKNNDK